MEIRFHTRLVMSIHMFFHVLKREESKHFYCEKRYKRGCFSIFDGPQDTELKKRASSGHAHLQCTNFEGSLKKIGIETKKLIQNNGKSSCPSASSSVYC